MIMHDDSNKLNPSIVARYQIKVRHQIKVLDNYALNK